MNFKLIKSEEDYQLAINRLYEIFNAPAGTHESDEADVLAKLIEEYETTHYPI